APLTSLAGLRSKNISRRGPQRDQGANRLPIVHLSRISHQDSINVIPRRFLLRVATIAAEPAPLDRRHTRRRAGSIATTATA
ncbi:MAG: hypothetical protein E6575_29635, partial [Bradyrhizobium sp.]|nr:hypothetical protein [Bradyrhizobium sp.]